MEVAPSGSLAYVTGEPSVAANEHDAVSASVAQHQLLTVLLRPAFLTQSTLCHAAKQSVVWYGCPSMSYKTLSSSMLHICNATAKCASYLRTSLHL